MKNPYAVALGKIGGKTRTKAKAESSRRNGARGGRPKLCKKSFTQEKYNKRNEGE